MDARVPIEVPEVPAPQRTLTHRDRQVIVLGVLLPVFMGSVDQTILASALPIIGREFDDFQTLPWLITTYLIGVTATTPLYGKLADIYGRRVTVLVALGLYIVGSLVCAFAPNMGVLILGRVLHGLGGGGLTSGGMIVLGDVAPPKDRAKYYAYFSMVYTTAGAIGPALGGFLSEHVHWSAIFWLNLPLGIIAIGLVLLCLKKLPRHERPHKLDIVGAVLIVIATVTFMLALNLGGVTYAWTSWQILSLASVAALLGFAFVLRIRTAPEPLIPISILRDPVACCTIVVNAFGWGGILASNIFLPMYFQHVMGLSPTNAGLSLIILMMTLNISAGLGAPVIGWARRYKILPGIGLALTIVTMLILGWYSGRIDPFWFQVILFVMGLGFGPLAPLSTVALQNAVPTHQFGTAIGAMNFARMLFTTMLVAIYGAILMHGASSSAAGIVYTAESFSRLFYAAAICLAIAGVALYLMEAKPLRTSHT